MSASLWPLSGDWGQREETAGMMGQWEEASRSVRGLLPPPIKSAPPSLVSQVPEEGVEVATPIINQVISSSGLGSHNCKAQRFGPIGQNSNLALGGALLSPSSTFCLALRVVRIRATLSPFPPSLGPRIPRESQAATCFLVPSEWVLWAGGL